MADTDIVIRVRTDGIAGADSALKRLGDTGVRTETITQRMVTEQDRLNQSMQASTIIMKSMAAVGMVSFLTGTTVAVAKLTDSWTNLTNKLANANSANERMVDLQERVYNIAQTTRTSLDATATLYARMSRSLDAYGVSAQQVARITETVNKAMIVSGATAEEASAAIVQLSQGLQSGTLRGDEFRSVAEQAPRLLQAMANSLNVTTGELRALAGQGQLTGTVVANAIYQSSEAIDKEFNKTIATFSQKLAMAENNLVKFAGTNATTAGATKAFGDAIVGLSENLDVLANVAGYIAVAYGGKLVGAFLAAQAASVQSALSMARETAAAQALTSARVQDALAGVEQAKQNLLVAASDREAAKAALAADQAYYRGIATSNAVAQSRLKIVAATEAVVVAENTLNASIATTIRQQTALNVVMSAGRGVLALMGGPVGAIALAASAFYMYNESQKQAIESSRTLATDTETLTDRLSKLTTEQQKALEVELQRGQVRLADQLKEEQNTLKELQDRLYNANQAMKNSTEGSWAYRDAQKAVKELGDDIVVQNGQISTTQQQLSNTRDNLKTVTDNLAAGERQLKAAVQDTNSAMGIAQSAAAKRTEDLTRALQGQASELDIATLKLQGHTREAAILQDVQNRMSKVYSANKTFIDNYIAGHTDATAVLTNEQRGIVEFINTAGKAYDAQAKLKQQQKDAANAKSENKQAASYAEQWNKAYERTEARGATALDRLRVQQDAEVRQMERKASNAGATEEQLQSALAAIDAKYLKERQNIASQFSPLQSIEQQYSDSNKVIAQLQKEGLLSQQEINQARLNAESTYLQQRSQLIADQAVSERDKIAGEYDPEQEAKNQYDSELARLTFAHEQKLVTDQKYYELRHDAYSKFLQDQAQAQNAEVMGYIGSASQLAQGMADLLDAAGAKGSAAYSAMYALSKGFAIANATLNLTTAISQAMADPTAITPAQKFANMAAIAAAGGALVSQISSATMTGMAHDGITEIPKEGTWLLQKGERVLSAQQNADFTNYMRNGGSGGGNGNAGVTINQQFNVTGNGDKALEDAMRQAAKDGAEQGYNKVLQDTTSRGNISRSIGR